MQINIRMNHGFPTISFSASFPRLCRCPICVWRRMQPWTRSRSNCSRQEISWRWNSALLLQRRKLQHFLVRSSRNKVGGKIFSLSPPLFISNDNSTYHDVSLEHLSFFCIIDVPAYASMTKFQPITIHQTSQVWCHWLKKCRWSKFRYTGICL